MLITAEEALAVTRSALERAGVAHGHARLQADVLVEAELRGHPSHGLQRLPRLVSRIARGLVDVSATGKHRWRSKAYLSVDGQRGLGVVVAMHALDSMLERLPQTGIVIAGVSGANHIGMLAPYVERVAEAGHIGIALSSSEALVHPYGGAQAMLGTNPAAISVPARDGEPFVLDLATSMVSMGKVHDYAMRGEPLEPDWALDVDGNPTTNAHAAKSGSIAPFGGAKGYGLGLAFELLVAAIAGSAFAPDVRGTLDDQYPANKGDVFFVIDAARPGLADAVSGYLDSVRQSRSNSEHPGIAVPGDGARARREHALAHGFSVAPDLWSLLTGPKASMISPNKQEAFSS